jgi:hypothetical protein
MLAYTLNRLLTERAVVERDMGQVDAYGADGAPDWQQHLIVPCRMWWAVSQGARTANRTYVTPARAVPVSDGGMLVPTGTDITEADRIPRVLTYSPAEASWVPYIEGAFTISSVVTTDDHVEVGLIRTVLGG